MPWRHIGERSKTPKCSISALHGCTRAALLMGKWQKTSRYPFDRGPALAENRMGPAVSLSWRMPSSGILRCVALVRPDVSEEPSASIIRVTRIGELGTTLAVTSNRRKLWRTTNLQEPYGITSQKTAFFIVTAVNTSNLMQFTAFFTITRQWVYPEADEYILRPIFLRHILMLHYSPNYTFQVMPLRFRI
jgi:branched-subunit amino acid aminotransferase/4-amino-4-deoxychorismate lyase